MKAMRGKLIMAVLWTLIAASSWYRVSTKEWPVLMAVAFVVVAIWAWFDVVRARRRNRTIVPGDGDAARR